MKNSTNIDGQVPNWWIIILNSNRYKHQLKIETQNILQRGIFWAMYITLFLVVVVILNIYFFAHGLYDIKDILPEIAPVTVLVVVGFFVIKLLALNGVTSQQSHTFLILLVLAWCYLLYGLVQLSSDPLPGIESLADILALVFVFALFPNRKVMLLAILPFLLFSCVYRLYEYPDAPVFPLTKFVCVLAIIMSGQKIISGWFVKAVIRDFEKQKLVKQFKRLALIDGLTNISNRRHFDEILAQEIRASERNNHALAIILLDIDFFKRLNDTLGHQAGDEQLVKVAEIISAAVSRPRDLVARYGGEEFVIALPNTDLLGAIHVADKVKSLLAEAELIHPCSDVSEWVTLSQGIAQWEDGMSKDNLVKMADRMLYRAKSAGRNTVCSDEQSTNL
ncbi:GGDEF domain-containing protein [Shewanella gelidimarina]|uniref:GGDEF domain-containing protein n=1 Tax=Shewanella gelidimarina TaxID=56813 RepID=UPI0020102BB4|nr:GGDEF domain-containing protein [Shewanella gelidimarina]MCL1057544.1 GGDEF domain-containing protein [Shewanella gelidimarina]